MNFDMFSKKKESKDDDTSEFLGLLASVGKEVDILERVYHKLSKSIEELKEKQTEEALMMHAELLELQRKLELIKRQVTILIYEMKRTTATLSYVIRKEELNALKKRISLWAPEKLVMRKEFLKMIEEAKDNSQSEES